VLALALDTVAAAAVDNYVLDFHPTRTVHSAGRPAEEEEAEGPVGSLSCLRAWAEARVGSRRSSSAVVEAVREKQEYTTTSLRLNVTLSFKTFQRNGELNEST
jgi:hypothetical protein